MKDNKDNCRQAEELLIQKIHEGITADEERELTAHLKNCKSCMEFEISLKQIKNTAKLRKTDIQPDPQTLKNHRNRQH